jgi:hypothetical protein
LEHLLRHRTRATRLGDFFFGKVGIVVFRLKLLDEGIHVGILLLIAGALVLGGWGRVGWSDVIFMGVLLL